MVDTEILRHQAVLDSEIDTVVERDEPKRAVQTPELPWMALDVPDPADVEKDRAWQDELFAFVGRIALKREHLCTPVFRSDLLPALSATIDIVNELVKFLTERLEWESNEHCLHEVVESAGKYFAEATQAIQSTKPTGWFRLAKKGRDLSVSQAAKLFCDFTSILERCFSALDNGFNSVEFKLQWIRFCGVFLTEIRNDLRWAMS